MSHWQEWTFRGLLLEATLAFIDHPGVIALQYLDKLRSIGYVESISCRSLNKYAFGEGLAKALLEEKPVLRALRKLRHVSRIRIHTAEQSSSSNRSTTFSSRIHPLCGLLHYSQ
jgi:hypothetical protein